MGSLIEKNSKPAWEMYIQSKLTANPLGRSRRDNSRPAWEILPAHFAPHTSPYTQTLGPQNCPARLAPHTISGAREGVLVAVAAVKTRRIDLHVPRNGSGEPARAWSPAWDTIVRGSLQWLPARVMFVLPRWHTQRCGRCPNSRYLYGQTRALPLSSITCSART